MLDQRPSEPEWLSWTLAGGWAALILVTVPLAPATARLVAQAAGEDAFLWLTAGTVTIALATAGRLLLRRSLPRSALVSLFLFGGALIWLIWSLRAVSVEAFHVIQYGVLSLLIYRALLHRCADVVIFPLAALVTAMFGILDEWLQWLVPNRYFGFKDVGLNFLVAVLALSAFGAGLRPTVVRGWPRAASLRRLAVAAGGLLLMLAASYANTPDAVRSYASRLPGLGYLLDSESMMVEYGHLYEDPAIGIFRSRFSLGQLEILDRERGAEVAGIVDSLITDDDWDRFRRRYTVPRDAYAHEFGTHLFRRNRHLALARDKERLEWQRKDSYLIAERENRIMENYFPTAIGLSGHQWSAAVRQEVRDNAPPSGAYVSAVSLELVTVTGRTPLVTALVLAAGGFLLAGLIGGRTAATSRKVPEEIGPP